MSGDLSDFLRGHRRNAILSWLLAQLILIAVVTNLLREDLLWAGFATVVLVLTVLPPVGLRDPYAMIPWEVTVLAALPVLGRSFEWLLVTDLLETYLFDAGDLAMYLSVAAIALVLAVELHLFSPVRMSDSFAVAFVVVATLATAGIWALVRWSSDLVFDTGYLLEPGLSEAVVEEQLMLEFVASAVAGLLAGLVFTFYVRRRVEPSRRLPEGMAP